MVLGGGCHGASSQVVGVLNRVGKGTQKVSKSASLWKVEKKCLQSESRPVERLTVALRVRTAIPGASTIVTGSSVRQTLFCQPQSDVGFYWRPHWDSRCIHAYMHLYICIPIFVCIHAYKWSNRSSVC